MNAAVVLLAAAAAATVAAGLMRPSRTRDRVLFTAGTAVTAAVFTARRQAERQGPQ